MRRFRKHILLLTTLAVLLAACRNSVTATSSSPSTVPPAMVSSTPTAIATAQPTPMPTTTAVSTAIAVTGVGTDPGARPLHLPALAPGAPCPVTPWQPASNVDPAGEFSFPGLYNAFGQGPIYPILYNFDIKRGAVTFAKLAAGGPAGRQDKVLWIAGPTYKGTALIRARQLGGVGILPFAPTDSTPARLRFPVDTGVGSADSAQGWRDLPSSILVPSPGCYAFQVDGRSFSDVIVFQVSGVPIGTATAQTAGQGSVSKNPLQGRRRGPTGMSLAHGR